MTLCLWSILRINGSGFLEFYHIKQGVIKLKQYYSNKKIGIIETVFRGRRMEVMCSDGKKRMTRIPSRLKKGRRISRIHDGNVVEVVPWDIQDEKCDIVSKIENKSKANAINDKIFKI